MKRRTFISMMSVMAAAGVLTLSGCSNSSTSTAASAGASSAAGSAADHRDCNGDPGTLSANRNTSADIIWLKSIGIEKLNLEDQ